MLKCNLYYGSISPHGHFRCQGGVEKSFPNEMATMSRVLWIFVAASCYISGCKSLNPSLADNTQTRKVISPHTHVFKESSKHMSSRTNIEKRGRIRHDQTHEVIFAVQQKNIDELTSILYDISDPDSPNYGQHWSNVEVTEFTSNPQGRDAVVSYLNSNGASVVSETRGGEYITAQAPVKIWEKIFDTEFFAFRMTHSDASVNNFIRAEHYSVPRELDEHLASVFNTIEMFDQMPKKTQSVPMAKKGEFSTAGSGYMEPDSLRSYYNMTGTRGSVNSTQMIYGSIGQYFSPANLASFQAWSNSPVIPATTIGGHVNDSKCYVHHNCAEANMDMQYIMTMSPYSPTTFWYTDHWFTTFLTFVVDTEKPPLIISFSYGQSEVGMPLSNFVGFDTEAIKLGIQGTTILASSGDDGVHNFHSRGDRNQCGYAPLFPASSPYVISVGGTVVS